MKENCNFLDVTLIFVHILMKHSGLSEGDYCTSGLVFLFVCLLLFLFFVLCGFLSKCELFPGKAYSEFIIKRDLKFADIPVLEAGQPRTANLVLYPIRVKRLESFYQEYFTHRLHIDWASLQRKLPIKKFLPILIYVFCL